MQAKLTISEPGDQYEQEADRVAETVMRMPEPIASEGVAVSGQVKDVHTQPVGSADAEHLHRQTMDEEMPEEEEETLQAKEVSGETPEVTPELEARVTSARGRGQPLPESVRAFFEPRFGYDFGGVRVHTDGQAVDSARSVKAHAYTLGQDIVFGSGQYAPETPAGKQLLAHELTHVVQQQAGRVSRLVIQRATIPYGQISWSDFKNTTRPAEAGAPSQNVGAVIQTKFDLIPTYSGTSAATPTRKSCRVGGRRDTEVEATVAPEPVDFTKPEAVMIQEGSWAQPRFNTPIADFCRGKARNCATAEAAERARLLKHEQGHFDISNVMAKNMRESQKLKADSLPAKETRCGDQEARDAAWARYRSDVGPVLKSLGDEWLQQRIKAQDDYDTQTNRGGIQAKQTAWETAITGGLTLYYPPTAPKPAAPAAPAQPSAPAPANPPPAPAPKH